MINFSNLLIYFIVSLIVGVITAFTFPSLTFPNDSDLTIGDIIKGIILSISGIVFIGSLILGLFGNLSLIHSEELEYYNETSDYIYVSTEYEENTVVAAKDFTQPYSEGHSESSSTNIQKNFLFFITTKKISESQSSSDYESGMKYIVRCMVEDIAGIITPMELDINNVKFKRGNEGKALKEYKVYKREFNNVFAKFIFKDLEETKIKYTDNWILEIPEGSLSSEVEINLE